MLQLNLSWTDDFWDQVLESIEPDTMYFWSNDRSCQPITGALTSVHFKQ